MPRRRLGLRRTLLVVGAALLVIAVGLLAADRFAIGLIPVGRSTGLTVLSGFLGVLGDLRMLAATLGAALIGAAVIVGAVERQRFEAALPYELTDEDEPPRLFRRLLGLAVAFIAVWLVLPQLLFAVVVATGSDSSQTVLGVLSVISGALAMVLVPLAAALIAAAIVERFLLGRPKDSWETDLPDDGSDDVAGGAGGPGR